MIYRKFVAGWVVSGCGLVCSPFVAGWVVSGCGLVCSWVGGLDHFRLLASRMYARF